MSEKTLKLDNIRLNKKGKITKEAKLLNCYVLSYLK